MTAMRRPKSDRVIYFGAWSKDKPEHYLYTPAGFPEYVDSMPPLLRPEAIDGQLAPVDMAYPEGLARLHDIGEWTALAFWDRSACHLIKGNSVFLARGRFGFAQLCLIAQDAFPTICARFQFKVQLWKPGP